MFDGPTGNGGNYGGAATANFGVYGCYTGDFTDYRCRISDPCEGPPDVSAPAALLSDVTPVIVTQPAPVTVCPGGNAVFSVAAAPAGLTYQWEIITGAVLFQLNNVVDGPTGNGGTYSGAQTPTLTISGVTFADTQNTWFRCTIKGPCGAAAAVTIQVAVSLYDTPPVIVTQPDSGPLCKNASKQISVAIAPGNYGPVTYQWYRYVAAFPIYVALTDGPLPSGASVNGAQTLALTLSNVQQQDAGQYYCMVTTACTMIPSAVANLTWCPTDIDCSGGTSADDIFAFLAIWFAGPPGSSCVTPPVGCPGDWNNDGVITADDIFAFLNDWFAAGPGSPCP